MPGRRWVDDENDGRDGRHRRGRAFGRGVLRTAGVLVGFLAFGTGWASLMTDPPPAYAPGMSESSPRVWLIDGYNAICAGLLGGRDRAGWWKAERRDELLERLEHFDDPTAELWVVFDGADPGDPARGRVRAVFSPSADAWLIEQVKARGANPPVAVVTGDRQVADRARHRGAQVVEPAALLGRCLG